MSSLRNSSLKAPRIPVSVIGGGLGAFTAALSLHRAGIQNHIFIPESKLAQYSPAATFIGGSAVRVLDRLGLGSDYRLLGSPVTAVEVDNVRGDRLLSFRLDGFGREAWAVPKDRLLQLFLEAIPPGSAHFGHRLRALRCAPSDEAVELDMQHVADHRGAIRPARMRHVATGFVIGADGHASDVRMFMSRPVISIPSGTTVWRAVVRHTDFEEVPMHVGREMWDYDRRFGYVRISADEVMWWAIMSHSDMVILRPFTPHLQKMLAHFPRIVAKLIASTDSDRHVHRKEMRTVWEQLPSWVDYPSRIALVGGAARSGTAETFHTGDTFAVDDGYVLANVLVELRDQTNGAMLDALDKYDENRGDHLSSSQTVSKYIHSLASSPSFVRRYLSSRFLRGAIERTASQGMSAMTATVSLTNSKNGRRQEV